ncbi:hypothetical protein BLNAU_9323 [Blattamonas nauphoetae]|uniref:Protein kinase domain-containing protein n=1 Tax=Blattamonas nauphoetae TaxID=2049346 RepID=A0ABQ9XWB6_9EUKA|nr:hypothetical protein BLNAU_9323 [Blattamonas nauphoetae]
MLGCVVSLTSSHLSGSTIRDVNTGGSVLCSNSSFSSLLPSPNSDADSNQSPTPIPADTFTADTYEDGTEYYFSDKSGGKETSTIFSHCQFTGDKYPSTHPLSFNQYTGTISILSCSFTNLTRGAVNINVDAHIDHESITFNSSNFTNCSAATYGGALCIQYVDGAVIDSCRFENCSTTALPQSSGGGLYLRGTEWEGHITQFQLVGCVVADCTATREGAGVSIAGLADVSVVDSKFERCEIVADSFFRLGGGISVTEQAALTVERSHFIECSTFNFGGAIFFMHNRDLTISDTLVKDCSSGTTGAICVFCIASSGNLSFTRVFFDGNSVGDETNSFATYLRITENATKFPDVAVMSVFHTDHPTLKFEECVTTHKSDSSGMIVQGAYNSSSYLYDSERLLDPEFAKIGALLTAKPTASLNKQTGKIELEMEGMTPPTSQEYEVTVKENGNGAETKLRMLFSDGIGTLVSAQENSLKYNTGYTIISIVGIVSTSSSSSSSRMTNGITVPAAAWVFNIAATPNYLTFTTPKSPPSLTWASSELISDNQKYAKVLLVFDEKVHGSFDIVVEEEGKDVILTVPILGEAPAGDSQKFIVVGKDSLLTHDTTYTIQSIVPTPETDTPFVFMNGTITLHIPKSSYNPNKAMSPETKALLSWLIPLASCLLIALVVVIVIIVLLRRRKQKKNAFPAQNEMEAQEPLEVEKVEAFGVECSNRVIRTDGNDHSAFDSPEQVQSNKETVQQNTSPYGEVMACSGDFEISAAPMTNTLYSVLHKEHREIGKRAIGIQVVNGLKQVVAHREWSDVLTRLSSHWILIDAEGNVRLKLQMNASEAEQEAALAQMQNPLKDRNENEQTVNEASAHTEQSEKDKSGMDGLRWRAPEVVAAEDRNGVKSVDGHKASVFSLGLVLWEIETGQVPFGELDAVNAQRQSGTGIGPKMESLQNEEFIALIHRCLSVDPKQRPTLSEIGEFLSSHPDETIGGSRNEMKEPEH